MQVIRDTVILGVFMSKFYIRFIRRTSLLVTVGIGVPVRLLVNIMLNLSTLLSLNKICPSALHFLGASEICNNVNMF
jgi:hypothetical protein